MVGMSTVSDIESAVSRLSPESLAEFRAWFTEFDSDQWDAQIERDAACGKLDVVADEALADLASMER
jgi:hypothetical protein